MCAASPFNHFSWFAIVAHTNPCTPKNVKPKRRRILEPKESNTNNAANSGNNNIETQIFTYKLAQTPPQTSETPSQVAETPSKQQAVSSSKSSKPPELRQNCGTVQKFLKNDTILNRSGSKYKFLSVRIDGNDSIVSLEDPSNNYKRLELICNSDNFDQQTLQRLKVEPPNVNPQKDSRSFEYKMSVCLALFASTVGLCAC